MSRLEVCGQLDNVGSLPIDSSTYQLCLSDDVLAHWIHCDLSGYGTAAGSEMRKMGGGFPELEGFTLSVIAGLRELATPLLTGRRTVCSTSSWR